MTGFGRTFSHALWLGLVFTAAALRACPDAAPAQTPGSRNYGVQLRIRHVFLDNALDLDQEQDDKMHFLRVRSALWYRWPVTSRLELYARLNNEFRRYVHPDVDFEIDEVIFENLYVRWTRLLGLPLDLTLGRQNIILGEGFLVMDGGPLDGSRTFYQNAVRLTWNTPSSATDIIAVSNPSKDEYLPVINDQDRTLVESDERLVGVHVSLTRPGGSEFQPYYFYKEEDPRPASPHHLRLHTPGMRVRFRVTEGVKIVAEAAVQKGDRCGENVSSAGGYAYVETATGYGGQTITVGGIYLSGVHDGTADPWNPLLSRWPKWSELYIYTLAGERGVAYWQNLAAGFVWLSQPIGRNHGVSGRIYYLGAPETRFPWGAGRLRGMNVQAEVRFRICPAVSGHLLAEKFIPESYYSSNPRPEIQAPDPFSNARSDAVFLRWQLLFDF